MWTNQSKGKVVKQAARFRVMVFYSDGKMYTVRKLGRAYASLNTAKANLMKIKQDGYIVAANEPYPIARKISGSLISSQ